MQQELSPFQREYLTLGRLARHAVAGLQEIFLLYLSQDQQQTLLVDPQSLTVPASVQSALSNALGGEPVKPCEERFFLKGLSLAAGDTLGALCLCRAEGPWPSQDLPLLDSIAQAYTYALLAQRDRQEAVFQHWVWSQMMDNTNACIYVTDPQSDKILFMNQYMKQAFRLEQPEGKVCWQVLQRGQSGRCAFCPVPALKGEQAAPSCVWEEHNPITGRIYENYDSMMRWSDGRPVHFQCSTDVTEARRLYKAAMTDELTGALSRLAGKEALDRLLDEYAAKDEPLCVCMLDINDLKGVNDQHGHAAGDALLKQVASSVRGQLKGQEYLMRLSGDEFVAVLPGARQGEAVGRMRDALDDFAAHRPCFYPSDDAFCYGVFEVRDRVPLRDVLARADERMYQQKRTLHIQRAQALLDQPRCAPAAFAYDTSRLYDALIQSTDSYIYVCNMRTGVFRYPPAMVAEFGLPSEVIANAAAVWGAKVHPHDKRIFLESNQEITDGRTDVHCVEYRARNVRGEWVWLRCRGHLQRDANGEPVLFAGFITNLGKRNRLDPLTGLYNKFELENDVQRALEGESLRPCTLIMLGLDGLKGVNALYDRAFGDEVIRLTAQRLLSLLPPNASLYRLDGDEFAILLRGDSPTAAQQLFFLIRQSFDCQQSFEGKKYYCPLSGGCAFAPRDGKNYVNLASCAAFALDWAKRRGKNRMECFSAQMMEDRRRAFELTELLRESVEQGFKGFQMHYQPVFTLDGRLIGAEALARWRCDQYGDVGPDQFIPLLEKSGLILIVGRYLLEQALTTCANWLNRMPDFEMSVNLSYLQLEDESLYPFLLEATKRSGVDPRHVILELTESYLAANMAQVTQRLDGIRKSGFRIAMDDFGTGYSSLGVLKQAPIDIAKIDRTFVQGIQSSAFDSAFLRLVVDLCSVIGIKTCLEGVETSGQLEAVKPMSLSYLQGFLLGRPMCAEDFERQFLA